ncbi:MAG TPA: hypothetical protein DDX92_12645 [Flavobacteriales bacterium]|jgi:hypothetical protein|nr:hypothetical protein [Flavobacteriales bacterium]
MLMLPKYSKFLLFIAITLFAKGGMEAFGQNKVVNVVIHARSPEDKKVKDVSFLLTLNEQEVMDFISPKAGMEFVIQPDDGSYKLRAEKDGYVVKEIFFNSFDYPYIEDYEIAEITLEMVPVEEGLEEIVQGKMVYSPARQRFVVNKIDTLPRYLRNQVEDQQLTIDAAYNKSMTYGAGLVALEEYEYARGYYDVAHELKPNDPEPEKMLAELDILIAQQHQKDDDERRHEEKTYISVQIGAFLKPFKMEVFDNVQEKKVISGQDNFTRVMTGEFQDRQVATQRLNEMRNAGFHDAFIVTMKENIRIGF